MANTFLVISVTKEIGLYEQRKVVAAYDNRKEAENHATTLNTRWDVFKLNMPERTLDWYAIVEETKLLKKFDP